MVNTKNFKITTISDTKFTDAENIEKIAKIVKIEPIQNNKMIDLNDIRDVYDDLRKKYKKEKIFIRALGWRLMDLTTKKSHVNLVNKDGFITNEDYDDYYDGKVKNNEKFRSFFNFQINIFT